MENKTLENNTYVTHIGVTEIPEDENKKRLVFYTTNQEKQKEGIFFVRFSPATFTKKRLDEAIQQKRTIELKEPIPLSWGQMLWLDSKGIVYKGSNSETNLYMQFLFTYKKLLEEAKV